MVTATARAYINHGRWVADCPRDLCTYAFELAPEQATYVCRTRQGKGCGMEAPIEWPPNADEIWAELERRPVESVRNWFPSGHPLAVAAGLPHGQTVADLAAEFAANGG